MSSEKNIKVKIAKIIDPSLVQLGMADKKYKSRKQDGKYHLISNQKKKKKISLCSKIIITLEFSFLFFTFILSFRKAMNLLLKNNKQEVEDILTAPKNKQIFKQKAKYINICICTFVKNQNLYLTEFIEYYLRIGINKIYLYDNNDESGEFFDDLLKIYIYYFNHIIFL